MGQESPHGADWSKIKRVISIEDRQSFYPGLEIKSERGEVSDLISIEKVGRFVRLALSGYVGKSSAGVASTFQHHVLCPSLAEFPGFV